MINVESWILRYTRGYIHIIVRRAIPRKRHETSCSEERKTTKSRRYSPWKSQSYLHILSIKLFFLILGILWMNTLRKWLRIEWHPLHAGIFGRESTKTRAFSMFATPCANWVVFFKLVFLKMVPSVIVLEHLPLKYL